MLLVTLAALLFVPAVAFAQEVIVNPESTDALVQTLITAVQTDQWLVAAGVATMLIVVAIRRSNVLSQLPPKYTPWVAVGVSVAFGIATSIVAGLPLATALVQGVTQGILVGSASSGFWELLKNLDKKPVA